MPVKKGSTAKKPQTTRKTTTQRTQKSQRTTKKPQKKSTINRGLMGIIYITLAVITIFSIIGFDGFLLGFYKSAVAFFIGFGIYVLPVVFIMLGILCFINFKGNTSLRTGAVLAFPLTLSCFAHIVTFGDTYKLNFENLKEIIDLGLKLKSAGLVGGFFSLILEASISSVGAIILLFVINVILLFIAFNLTPKAAYKAIISYFDSLGYEDENEEYELSSREMRKAQKEKQKEHIEKLKEAKKQAYNEYKEKAEVKTPKKYQQFNIDIPLDEKVTLEDTKEIPRVEVDNWVKEEYERIKEREEAAKNQKQQEIDHVMENLNELELLERRVDGFSANEPFKFEDIEKEVASEVSFELGKVAAQKEFNESESFIEPKEFKEPEIFIAPSTVNSVDEEQIVSEIREAIDEVVSENTAKFEFLKKEIQFDELKSTMKYEVVSKFNQKELKYEYQYPPITLLHPKLKGSEVDPTEELRESSERLIETLESFGVAAEIIHIVRGPSITRFEITISKGVKFSKITSLSDDIALSLGAANVRIATIPDKVAIGIEVPNKSTEMVLIKEVIDSREFRNTTSKLSYALGKDITGSPYIGDIAKMPHMLIAGTTGSGKSVCVNSMLVSLLYKADPNEVKFIMIDPKMVELGGYNGIPHLLIPVVTDPRKAAGALNWAVGEMMKRYKLFAESNVKDLVSYNIVVERKISEGDTEAKKMPQIVIVIDELADLMMIAAKEVEESICRIAQMARAAGMHLVIATQRPSSDVITGIMKANIPSRISFAVSSQIESRIILDTTGAEKLIGKGDMLYNPLGASKPQRLQGCFITASEVEAVVSYVKAIADPDYNEEVLSHIENHSTKDMGGNVDSGSDDGDEDTLINDAIDIIVSTGQASTSFLQRKLKIGYARASRIIDQIEDRGIIGPADGSKPRQVLISKSQWNEMKIRRLD